VVVNLISNAHQAMRLTPSPRRLTLTTRVSPRSGRVVLEVADTGPGVPPEIQSRIFEPFFTTKALGQGTGLGLSLCYGIVAAHRGSIVVETEPGHGAVFRVELPVKAPSAVAPEARVAEVLPVLPGKRILVVDDEPRVLDVVADILSRDGHRVEKAADGVQALDKLREGSYDLILTDIRMPELDGPSLYRELERRDPRLCRRVIFLTGDMLNAETREFLEQTGAPRLMKPFPLEELRRAVRRHLQARAAGSEPTGGS
jgi:two-component system NtrC family sensor kinase